MLTWLVAEAWMESCLIQIMKKPDTILAPEVIHLSGARVYGLTRFSTRCTWPNSYLFLINYLYFVYLLLCSVKT